MTELTSHDDDDRQDDRQNDNRQDCRENDDEVQISGLASGDTDKSSLPLGCPVTKKERTYARHSSILGSKTGRQYAAPSNAAENIERFRGTVMRIFDRAQDIVRSLPYILPASQGPFIATVMAISRQTKRDWLAKIVVEGYKTKTLEVRGRVPCTMEDLLKKSPPPTVVS